MNSLTQADLKLVVILLLHLPNSKFAPRVLSYHLGCCRRGMVFKAGNTEQWKRNVGKCPGGEEMIPGADNRVPGLL